MTCSACQALFTVSGSAVSVADTSYPGEVVESAAGHHPLGWGAGGLGPGRGRWGNSPVVAGKWHAPEPARPTETCQWTGTLGGLLTPPALALITFLCIAGGPLGIVVAGVGIAYLTKRFTNWYVTTHGDAAFYYYKRSASTAFLFLPAMPIAFLLLHTEAEEEAEMFLLVLAIGLYFASLLLAAAWLAGIKWAGWR